VHPADIAIVRQALKKLVFFTTAPTFRAALGGPVGGIKNIIDSNFDGKVVEDYVKANAASIHHVSGSCQMTKRGDEKYGVVDPDLKVKGVKGLRIVDASIFVSFFYSFFEELEVGY
jgi:choline dehydrogenase-like flavoprotein